MKTFFNLLYVSFALVLPPVVNLLTELSVGQRHSDRLRPLDLLHQIVYPSSISSDICSYPSQPHVHVRWRPCLHLECFLLLSNPHNYLRHLRVHAERENLASLCQGTLFQQYRWFSDKWDVQRDL